jgi:toxic anion resistance protein TelA
VAAFVEDVAGPVERPTALRQRLVDLDHLGAAEVTATSRTTARIAERAARRGDASRAVAASLRELQRIVGAMNPGNPDRFDAYLDRYERNRDRIDGVLAALADEMDRLAIDIALRRQDERSLEVGVASLARYVVMAGRLDDALAARLDELAATEPWRARSLRDEVLLAARSRRRDLLLHLEVATQSLLGLRALDSHDETLRDAVTLVRTTAVAALDSAAVVARMRAERRDKAALRDAVSALRGSWEAASAALASADATAR